MLKKLTEFDKYEEIKLDNGLTIYLVPNKEDKFKLNFFVNTGSFNLKTYVDGKLKEFSPGSHHFLEHLLFNKEDGDIKEKFNKLGLIYNAATSCFSTNYYVLGSNHLEDALKILIDLVTNPYFTEELVEKEKGIILEELNGCRDSIPSLMYYTIMNMTFNSYPVKYNVLGEEKDIKKMNLKMITDLYNSYYTYENMALIVAGKFNKNKILKILKTELPVLNKNTIKEYKYHEPEEVVRNNVTLKHNLVVNEKQAYVFKIKIPKDIDKHQLHLLLNVYFKALMGNTSLFFEEGVKNNLFTSFSTQNKMIKDYLIVIFSFNSNNVNKLKKIINQELKKKLDIIDFKRAIKNEKNYTYLITESVDGVVDKLIYDLVTFKKIMNQEDEEYNKLKYENLKIITGLLNKRAELLIRIVKN